MPPIVFDDPAKAVEHLLGMMEGGGDGMSDQRFTAEELRKKR